MIQIFFCKVCWIPFSKLIMICVPTILSTPFTRVQFSAAFSWTQNICRNICQWRWQYFLDNRIFAKTSGLSHNALFKCSPTSCVNAKLVVEPKVRFTIQNMQILAKDTTKVRERSQATFFYTLNFDHWQFCSPF